MKTIFFMGLIAAGGLYMLSTYYEQLAEARRLSTGKAQQEQVDSITPIIKSQRYALMDKKLIPSNIVPHPTDRTTLGFPVNITIPPQYMFICMGEDDKEMHIFEVPEFTYKKTPIRKIIKFSETSNWAKHTKLPDKALRVQNLKDSLLPVKEAEKEEDDIAAYLNIIRQLEKLASGDE